MLAKSLNHKKTKLCLAPAWGGFWGGLLILQCCDRNPKTSPKSPPCRRDARAPRFAPLIIFYFFTDCERLRIYFISRPQRGQLAGEHALQRSSPHDGQGAPHRAQTIGLFCRHTEPAEMPAPHPEHTGVSISLIMGFQVMSSGNRFFL